MGGYQYVHNGGTASDTVVNSDGWQIVKKRGGVVGNTTVNQKGRLQVDAGGTATNVTPEAGRRTGYQYGCNRYRHKPPWSILGCGG